MIEVESKVLIKNPKEIKESIKKFTEYIKKEKKIDDYYSLSPIKSYPKKSLRIRKKEGIHIVNFKRSISYKEKIHAKKEVEFFISDISGFLELIHDFGFEKWLRKEKTTHLYKIKNNFHIELNEVKNLGWFLEIEYLVKTKNEIKDARSEILKILKELGFTKKDFVKEGYTKLLWDKYN